MRHKKNIRYPKIDEAENGIMLKSEAKWILQTDEHDDVTKSDKHSIIEQLFIARGIYDETEREKFLHPRLNDLQSPESLAQIERVKARIDEAIDNEELVIVYGDYDADGVTSTTILVKTLRSLGVHCEYYIPNRFTEGYGIHEGAIEAFAEQNVALIITVDTGIANIEEVELASHLGIDVIITDHHEVQDVLPEAYAIIHPDLSPLYNFKQLAGVGVAWQIAHYLLGEQAYDMLDLVAIGTIADLVPLIDENRILVTEGLKRIEQTTNIGLQKLIDNCNIKGPISERDIGFMIGPRLNAVGRLQNASLAVKLLLTENEEEATYITDEIESLNVERQQIVQQIVKEADERVNEDDAFILLADESWHEGVLGIAASRLVNTYQRPVMLLTAQDGTDEWKGSARSVPGFNLFENCMQIRHLFTNFGGHSQAAGMSLPKENKAEIRAFLNEQMRTNYSGMIGRRELVVHHSITVEQMTEELVAEIAKFAPFGMDNERPLFHLEAVPTQVRKLGQEGRHLKLQFKQADRFVEGIGFSFGKYAPLIAENSHVSLVGELQLNEWNGRITVQMNIQDIAVNQWQLFDYRGKRHTSHLQSFINHYEQNIVLCNDVSDLQNIASYEHVQLVTYEKARQSIAETEILYLYDLPPNLTELTRILKRANPKSIHVAYEVDNGGLLHTRPNREQFKQVYIYLASFKSVPLKQHYPAMMKQANVRKEQLSFILKVFHDLNFISAENNVVTLDRDAEKASLDTSATYQHRIEAEKVEEILYYSSQDELKQWLLQQIDVATKEEELSYGV